LQKFLQLLYSITRVELQTTYLLNEFSSVKLQVRCSVTADGQRCIYTIFCRRWILRSTTVALYGQLPF